MWCGKNLVMFRDFVLSQIILTVCRSLHPLILSLWSESVVLAPKEVWVSIYLNCRILLTITHFSLRSTWLTAENQLQTPDENQPRLQRRTSIFRRARLRLPDRHLLQSPSGHTLLHQMVPRFPRCVTRKMLRRLHWLQVFEVSKFFSKFDLLYSSVFFSGDRQIEEDPSSHTSRE